MKRIDVKAPYHTYGSDLIRKARISGYRWVCPSCNKKIEHTDRNVVNILTEGHLRFYHEWIGPWSEKT